MTAARKVSPAPKVSTILVGLNALTTTTEPSLVRAAAPSSPHGQMTMALIKSQNMAFENNLEKLKPPASSK